MGNKINVFVTGALALLGIGLSGNAQVGNVSTPSERTSIQNVKEKTPLFLEKFSQTNAKSDVKLVAWHESHASHASHASHVSHQSGY